MAEPSRAHGLPAVHALHLADTVARWGVQREELLAPLGLSVAALTEPEAELPLAVIERLVERAVALSGEPALGVFLGLRMPVSAHGYVGFAAMSASTVGEALDVATRYVPTRTSALGLRLVVDGEAATLVLEERAPLGGARELVVTALLVGLWQMGCWLTGETLRGRVELALPPPSWVARLGRLVPVEEVRWNRPAHALSFERSVLGLPLRAADAAALRLAREECERRLDALREPDVAEVVRQLLPRPDGFRSLEEVAAKLGLSPRTLRRRLVEARAPFKALLDEARRDRALELLRASRLSLDEIASRVGYSDCANFTRACRRWTGRSPGALRDERRE